MPNLIDIRRRIKSVKNTQQITKAMKMVSASKLRRASEQAIDARAYSEKLTAMHEAAVGRVPELKGPLYQSTGSRHLLVIFSSEKGLCGSFNANLFRSALEWAEKKGRSNVGLVCLGKKARRFFDKHSNLEQVASYTDMFRHVSVEVAEAISRDLVHHFQSGPWGSVTLLFNRFRNVLIQDVTYKPVLPLTLLGSDAQAPEQGIEPIAEPNLEMILQALAPKVFLTEVFQALLESAAAEHAARMTAMDAATNNASEMIDKLTLAMNKARQAAITKELIEIVSGAAAI